jgi:glycosyltransferase involved in cell wall biosynthesis
MDIRIIYDLDDDVWDLPDFNPARAPLMQAREGFKACIQLTDAVTVSTRTLANVVKKNVKVMVNNKGKSIPIVVIPNKIDKKLMVRPSKFEKQLIVGWAGSSSHGGDLAIMEQGYLNVSRDFPDVMFEIRGCSPLPGSSLADAVAHQKNFRFKVWMPVAEYCSRMPVWGWDVALAPLVEHDFNNSKSCLKMLEAAYCSTPCLASWVKPYDDFTSFDPELRWLLCASSSNWEPKLRELLNDDARRKELGMRCHAVMEQHFSFDGPHPEWQTLIQEVQA